MDVEDKDKEDIFIYIVIGTSFCTTSLRYYDSSSDPIYTLFLYCVYKHTERNCNEKIERGNRKKSSTEERQKKHTYLYMWKNCVQHCVFC